MAVLTLQPDNSTSADTYIGDTFPTTNSDGNGSLGVGERTGGAVVTRFVIKFDLSSLPDNILISSAVLSLKIQQDLSDNARSFKIYRLKKAFVASQATWNIYSTGNNWTTAGGFNAADCEQTAIGSADMTATETIDTVKDFALTPTTKSGLDLGNGWLIKADTESDDAWQFYSSDNATASYRPKLVITYTLLPSGFLTFL